MNICNNKLSTYLGSFRAVSPKGSRSGVTISAAPSKEAFAASPAARVRDVAIVPAATFMGWLFRLKNIPAKVRHARRSSRLLSVIGQTGWRGSKGKSAINRRRRRGRWGEGIHFMSGFIKGFIVWHWEKHGEGIGFTGEITTRTWTATPMRHCFSPWTPSSDRMMNIETPRTGCPWIYRPKIKCGFLWVFQNMRPKSRYNMGKCSKAEQIVSWERNVIIQGLNEQSLKQLRRKS